MSSRKSRKNEGFKVGMNLLCPRNSKKASVAGGQCAKEGRMGDRARVVSGAV